MSRGSNLILLREDNNIDNINELKKKYIDNINIYSYANYDVDTYNFPQFLTFKDIKFKWFDIINNKQYTELFNFHFISTFQQLREEWNMSEFNNTGETIIAPSLAKNIVQACDYLLSNYYSKEFEEILNNHYVKVLGEAYPPYVKFKTNNDKCYSEDDFWTEEIECHLNRLKLALNTYLEIKDDYDLIMLYKVYG